MKTIEELKKENEEYARLMNINSDLITQMEYDATLKKFGVKIGDKIECESGKFVVCNAKSYTLWLHGYQILKNGAVGSKERHIYRSEQIKLL